MLLAASNIAPEAYGDDSNQNQSEILRFSKNLDFRQFLKMEFEPHICCHEHDLSNITKAPPWKFKIMQHFWNPTYLSAG